MMMAIHRRMLRFCGLASVLALRILRLYGFLDLYGLQGLKGLATHTVSVSSEFLSSTDFRDLKDMLRTPRQGAGVNLYGLLGLKGLFACRRWVQKSIKSKKSIKSIKSVEKKKFDNS